MGIAFRNSVGLLIGARAEEHVTQIEFCDLFASLTQSFGWYAFTNAFDRCTSNEMLDLTPMVCTVLKA